jgi:hypothetical protein
VWDPSSAGSRAFPRLMSLRTRNTPCNGADEPRTRDDDGRGRFRVDAQRDPRGAYVQPVGEIDLATAAIESCSICAASRSWTPLACTSASTPTRPPARRDGNCRSSRDHGRCSAYSRSQALATGCPSSSRRPADSNWTTPLNPPRRPAARAHVPGRPLLKIVRRARPPGSLWLDVGRPLSACASSSPLAGVPAMLDPWLLSRTPAFVPDTMSSLRRSVSLPRTSSVRGFRSCRSTSPPATSGCP